MAFNDKEKRRLIALTRALKEEKGITIKKAELETDIARFREAQGQLDAIKQEYKDQPVVQKEADKEKAKLQSIIDELNDYMGAIYPEGLLDLGSDGRGKAIVAQG